MVKGLDPSYSNVFSGLEYEDSAGGYILLIEAIPWFLQGRGEELVPGIPIYKPKDA